MKNRTGDSLPALRRMATSGLVLFGRFSRWVSSRIFDGFTRGFALSVLSVGFPNYETILCSHIYMTNPCYTERIKTEGGKENRGVLQ